MLIEYVLLFGLFFFFIGFEKNESCIGCWCEFMKKIFWKLISFLLDVL